MFDPAWKGVEYYASHIEWMEEEVRRVNRINQFLRDLTFKVLLSVLIMATVVALVLPPVAGAGLILAGVFLLYINTVSDIVTRSLGRVFELYEIQTRDPRIIYLAHNSLILELAPPLVSVRVPQISVNGDIASKPIIGFQQIWSDLYGQDQAVTKQIALCLALVDMAAPLVGNSDQSKEK